MPQTSGEFPLPKQEPTPFEKQRALIGLFKLEPLETQEQLAQRVMQAWREYQRKTNTPKPDKES